ncbi:peptidylprolyl isomerase [Paramagnetospirillum kuznetsovii]|uniref:peptidylprolyl isomerase n=1 Tax=Paramagnetospirillum kuznetsovii TaxID=2053833 RepID=A0A364P2F3_9PROT|nr:peptidylprolyl isomerase [Paramagnetospirillum kuznetsovii]RAU23337.1 peptidylprolyl isomerase [Paramagnetospirillum kuznetsovii]
MTDIVARDTVVALVYRVSDPDGNVLDDGKEPMVYLHGASNSLFPKIQAALDGKAVGESVQVRLQPAEAFGEYDADLVEMEDADKFPPNLQIGMQFEGAAADGKGEPQIYAITDIADGKVVLDANHPLAGMVIDFACTVAAVRPATIAELSHGHAHDEDHPH